MKEALSSRLLPILYSGSAHVLVAIGFGRSSPHCPTIPGAPTTHVRCTSSEPEAEGGLLLRLSCFRASLANQTQDTPKHLFGITA